MKFPKLLLIAGVLGLMGCASQAIIFPELRLGDCPDGSDRAPSSSCRAQIGRGKYNGWDEVLKKFDEHLEKTDSNKGSGFANAALFLGNEKNPIRSGSPDKSFWLPDQVVSFYKPVGPFGVYNKGGSAVRGTPTRVYLTEEGQIAYVAFDDQPVSLLEFTAYQKGSPFSQIEGQGVKRHHEGFSSPVGKIKKLTQQTSQYTVDELRVLLGREDQDVTLEFESGVVVHGVIEKYTPLSHSKDNGRAVLITFKEQTCTVTFGMHTLFKPSWGSFDMLLMPQIGNSSLSWSH